MNTPLRGALRLRFYVGPAAAGQIAERVKDLNFNLGCFEVVPSTEHLTVMVGQCRHSPKLDVAEDLLAAMTEQLGTTFGLRAEDVR